MLENGEKMNIKVAVIDSGIDLSHRTFNNISINGVSILQQNGEWILNENISDYNGHGTACASVIINECMYIDIMSVGILNTEGKSDLQTLEHVLEKLIDSDVSIINMSLAVRDTIDKKLYEICQKLVDNNIILVAALANDHSYSFPAIFDNVIGVRSAELEKEDAYWFDRKKEIQCVIDCVASMVAVPENAYTMILPYNSIAAAKATGVICKILHENGVNKMNFDKVCSIMETRALKNQWREQELYEKHRTPNQVSWYISNSDALLKTVYKTVCRYFNRILCGDSICNIELLTSRGLLKMNCVYEFLKFIETDMNIHLDYLDINRYHLITIGTLTKYIRSLLEESLV